MNKIWEFDAFRKKAALIDDTGVSVSYDELFGMQNEVCEEGNGGELTMMLCQNSIGAIAGYSALLNSGHPMMMIPAYLPMDSRKKIMNTYRPGLVFVPLSVVNDFPHMQEVKRIYDYVLLRTSYPEKYPVNPELGLMLTTSGSTGSVKLVRQSWGNICFNAGAHADYLEITESERTITSLPMYYTYGLSIINANLLMGGTVIITGKGIMDEEFWDLFENEKVTSLHAVASTYEMLYKMDLFSEDFPDLRLMTQAGGKLGRDLQSFFAGYARDYKKRFIIMYGQCEATAAISYLPSERALDKPESVGIPITGGRIKLIDAKGNEIEKPHVQGEIVYSGQNVTLGYATCGEDLVKGDEWKGTLHTGDVGERDEEGYLYITGRLKRFAKMAGHRISLDEIDDRIMNEIHVRCISAGTDDDLAIFVTSDDDKEAVKDFIRQEMSILRLKTEVIKLDSFPQNEAGKILYEKLFEIAKRQ